MSLYKIPAGFGVDYRDEFGRRVRRFIDDQHAALILDAQLREKSSLARTALRNAWRLMNALCLG